MRYFCKLTNQSSALTHEKLHEYAVRCRNERNGKSLSLNINIGLPQRRVKQLIIIIIIFISYIALSNRLTQYLCALQSLYMNTCRQGLLFQYFSSPCCFGHVSLVYSSRWSLAGAYCCIHQTGGWTPTYTVATLPGHNYLQLTQIEFQHRGLNLGPLEPVDSKANCYYNR